jgi:hypothetical protein
VGRIKIPALLLLAIALPATARTFDFSIGALAPACLSVGNASYRAVPQSARADHAVRLDPAAATPDIRIQIVDSADAADFVFVDDGDAPPACQHKGAAVKTVKIDAAAPDLVAAVTTGAALADYRIYIRSRWMTPETAAALFAAAHAPRRLAGRTDRSN